MLHFIKRILGVKTVYINGMKASETDIAALLEWVEAGKTAILEWHFTKSNNISIKTI